MGDVGDDYRAWCDMKRKKKIRNKSHSTQLLISKGIKFDVKNNGLHLVVYDDKEIYDFYPSTGKYSARNSNKHGRGVRNLINRIKEQ